MGYYTDLAGKRYGHLIVLGYKDLYDGRSRWNVRCDCGTEKVVEGRSLTSGNTKSCGCARSEYMRSAIGTAIGDLTGQKWNAIVTNAKARGIKVAITQKQAAELFEKQGKKCALSGLELVLNKPVKQSQFITASLDRIDSSKGYEIGNVQWIHKDINKMKNTFDEKHFLSLCEAIVKNHRSRSSES